VNAESADRLALERLIFFSDAVIAIAITLLVLEIRLPVGAGELNNRELVQALLALWPKYLAYGISFLVIASFWMGHQRKFRHIRAVDRRLMWLNLLLLGTVAFIPFPTTIVAESVSRTATIFYAGVIILAGLLAAALWAYASSQPRLIDPNLTAATRRRELHASLALVVVFLISMGLAYVNADLARFSWLLLLVTGRVLK
jgi:uncharacterized membrane protein